VLSHHHRRHLPCRRPHAVLTRRPPTTWQLLRALTDVLALTSHAYTAVCQLQHTQVHSCSAGTAGCRKRGAARFRCSPASAHRIRARLRRTPPIPMQVPVHASRSSVCVLCVLLQSECGNAVRVARVSRGRPLPDVTRTAVPRAIAGAPSISQPNDQHVAVDSGAAARYAAADRPSCSRRGALSAMSHAAAAVPIWVALSAASPSLTAASPSQAQGPVAAAVAVVPCRLGLWVMFCSRLALQS
jgi:hypothetical protein